MKLTIFRATKAFGFLVALYLLIGVVAYVMPDAAVQRHVKQSLDYGDFREDYPKAIIIDKPYTQDQYTLDNFTDALILNQVYHQKSEGIKGILLMPRYDEGVIQYHNLVKSVNGEESEAGRTIHYARYWHGSTFFARIMLFFTSYTGVRYLLFLLSSLLLLWGIVRLWGQVGRVVALSMTFALLMVDVFVMQFSLQFVQVLLIAFGGIVWMTYRRGSPVLFFVLGSLTAFLDLITVPTLTLGLPLLVLLAMRKDQLKQGVVTILQVSLFWLAGYALTWLTKWGLATLLTGENIFADAVGQGSRWSENGGSYISEAISSCLGFLHWKYVLVALVALVIAAVVHPRKTGWPAVVTYLLVALIPFAYYVVMAHPAQHHAWFNYRALAVAVAALLMAAASMVDWNRYCEIGKKWNVLKRDKE